MLREGYMPSSHSLKRKGVGAPVLGVGIGLLHEIQKNGSQPLLAVDWIPVRKCKSQSSGRTSESLMTFGASGESNHPVRQNSFEVPFPCHSTISIIGNPTVIAASEPAQT